MPKPSPAEVPDFDLSELVDVVIPNFNKTLELERAVDSVILQGKFIRCIYIIDDGSDDNVKEFISKNIQKKEKVKVYFNSHTGLPGAARTFGILQTSATWIAFLDSDDWWEANKISVQLDLARRLNIDIVATNAYRWEDGKTNGNLLPKLPKSLDFKSLIRNNLVINSSVLVKRELLSQVDTYSNSIRTRAVEDFATWLRISTIRKIFFINQSLVNYTDSRTSIRSLDVNDPKVYALVDCNNWIKVTKTKIAKKRMLQKSIKREVYKIL
jgi:glycosyltransferase involved in cell wall biosynthesis